MSDPMVINNIISHMLINYFTCHFIIMDYIVNLIMDSIINLFMDNTIVQLMDSIINQFVGSIINQFMDSIINQSKGNTVSQSMDSTINQSMDNIALIIDLTNKSINFIELAKLAKNFILYISLTDL